MLLVNSRAVIISRRPINYIHPNYISSMPAIPYISHILSVDWCASRYGHKFLWVWVGQNQNCHSCVVAGNEMWGIVGMEHGNVNAPMGRLLFKSGQLKGIENTYGVKEGWAVHRMGAPIIVIGCAEFILVHGQVTIIFVVSVCLFVCAEFFSAVFDPISIKLGHVLNVWV